MDITARIEQWEKMAAEAPDGMAFFSLGNAYKDAERFDDAANAYKSAIELDEGLSRAYQSIGQMLIQLERNDEAGDYLSRGYVIAAERGDAMPQRAIGSLLEKIGRTPPKVEQEESVPVAVAADQIIDRRTNRPGGQLPDPPMRGPLGQFIYDHYSQETWNEWIGQGTKVINELRLDFSNADHQRTYDVQMMEWLGISQEDIDAHTAAKP